MCGTPHGPQVLSTPQDGVGIGEFNPMKEKERRRDALSPKQEELLAFLRAYIAERGYPASRAECAEAIEASQANIDYHLQQMAIRKWIEITPRVQRGIRLLREGIPVVDAESGEGLGERAHAFSGDPGLIGSD